jgi:hypothetical protein
MFSFRDILMFLAGAEALHAISHVVIGCMGVLPMQFFSIQWTQQLNTFTIVINILITAWLLYWANSLN